ncbi:MAG: DUF1553 domain-containing protein, partial [Verrucomicrobia bacterium]|nr:DUF1553 domain-containing protein [Verrucomicrobiota bacterium]
CHDHKFEPLSQRDYYSLQAFFTPSTFRDDYPVPNAAELAVHKIALGKYRQLTKREQDDLASIEAPYRQKLHEAKLAKLSPEAQLAHKTPSEQRTAEQINQIQETAALVEVTEKEILGAMSKEDRARHKLAKEALAKFPRPPPLPMTLALQCSKTNSAKTFVLFRGDYNRPGEEVQPGIPAVLRTPAFSSSPEAQFKIQNPKSKIAPAVAIESSRSRRTALAEWITDPRHPLTARIMVNRIWQYHFGRGLVATASDFGLKGERPSHPELLDWLANEFIARGWSIKEMHRLLLLSAVYQQTSRASSQGLDRDPENRFYSRWQRKRLEGEVIRDSLLAISGRLNPQMGGPGVFPPIPQDVFKGAKGWSVSPTPGEQNRRSLYIFSRRNLRFPFLEVFDAPDSNLTCPERPRSTSAPQSLTLLNADEVMAASFAAATRVAREAVSDAERIGLAYRLILGRNPTDREKTLASEFLRWAPWSELCRALFNVNAFVYVD